MDNFKFRLAATILLLLALLNPCQCQQSSIFNQTPYQRRQQALLRQQQEQQQQQLQQQQTFPGTVFGSVSPLTTLGSISPLPAAVPQNAYRAYPQTAYVPITAYQNELNYDGSFAYGYSSADGTTAQAQGFVKNLGLGEAVEAQVVQGSYSYTSPDGTPITVRYIADENGFRAEGAHIPTPPPIPEAIAKSLQYISGVQQQQQRQQQPFQQSGLGANPSLNPYQTPFRQFGVPQTLRLDQQQQLTPLQLQQQRYYQQQSAKQYQPDNQFNQQATALGLGSAFAGAQKLGIDLQRQQAQSQQDHSVQLQQQEHQQQQQQNLTTQRQQSLQTQQGGAQSQSTQQSNAQQLATQPLQGRTSQLLNPFGYNQYRRYKKATVA